jgi:hypothetical protein
VRRALGATRTHARALTHALTLRAHERKENLGGLLCRGKGFINYELIV